ncbi:hypothetical protein EC847_10250 [Scandinavium goeteborgense]|uniref:Uncharacterized protein n=1 Tax=Scandinavium goeteborgense TaxID=1851514 RepID=A0A4R6EP15_SCAGO|nr:hypothetical protein EC847_10250 [Scandinavium goeteborgense]
MTTAYIRIVKMRLHAWNNAIRVKQGEFELQ